MKILKSRNTLSALALSITLCILGIYVWNTNHRTEYPKTISELKQKYESKNDSWGEEDTNNCLNDYYRIYPDAKYPKKGTIYLAPPCPGVPQ